MWKSDVFGISGPAFCTALFALLLLMALYLSFVTVLLAGVITLELMACFLEFLLV